MDILVALAAVVAVFGLPVACMWIPWVQFVRGIKVGKCGSLWLCCAWALGWPVD